MTKFPPYLKQGDTVAITCPAGYMPFERAECCINTLKQWGYNVITGSTLGGDSVNFFSADDSQRLEELQEMFDDRKIKGILFGRGGYGMGRIIDNLDFKKFKKNPKWLIGFSDITILQSHLLSQYKLASIHGPMAAAFNRDGVDRRSLMSLKDAIEGRKTDYQLEPHPLNKLGEASGTLFGGNLALLAHLIGTPSDFESKNKILFLEDIGEYLYNIDRMLYQLKRSGKFKKIKGLIFGGFTDMKDTIRPFGKTIQEILLEFSQELDCPICFDFPVSHGRENVALKIGGKYKFTVASDSTRLTEL